jgi:large subunit ribosomal protein L6
MSRIGKLPVVLPQGVEVKIDNSVVTIKGKKGELSQPVHPLVQVEQKENEIIVSIKEETKEEKSLWGLTRALLNNMVTGVTEGFEKRLEVIGVGYRANATGKAITLNLGFSHPVEMQAPEGITVEVDKDTKHVVITGIDKQKVGQFAAEIRSLRKPEPYKGKGVRYVGEYVIRKVGKSAAKKG